jgi:uncharacterized membrane protein YfcA
VDDLAIELLAGVCVGASMGLVGAGGAVFTVPVFGALLGHAPKAAILEALAVTGAIAAVSAALAGARGLVDVRRVALLGSAGIVGTQLAAPVAVRMPSGAQVFLFVALALLVAWRMWRRKAPVAAGADGAVPPRAHTSRTIAIGAVVGVLTSVLGVGGGFLLTPALVLWERLPMPQAIGTSLAVIALNAAAGLAGQWWSGGFGAVDFDFGAVALTASFGVVGSIAGSRIAGRLPQLAVRRVFALMLAAAGVALAVRAARG